MNSGEKERFGAARLAGEWTALGIELLRGQCAMDRVRLRYSPRDIVAIGERETLKRALASAHALHRFFLQFGAQIEQPEDGQLAR